MLQPLLVIVVSCLVNCHQQPFASGTRICSYYGVAARTSIISYIFSPHGFLTYGAKCYQACIIRYVFVFYVWVSVTEMFTTIAHVCNYMWLF